MLQDTRLLPWRTVRENIAFVSPPDLLAAMTVLDALGFSGTDELYPGALSGGIVLARALPIEPDLLLLDEPFTALDPDATQTLQDALLRDRRVTGCTVLLVTYDAAEATSLTDQVV